MWYRNVLNNFGNKGMVAIGFQPHFDLVFSLSGPHQMGHVDHSSNGLGRSNRGAHAPPPACFWPRSDCPNDGQILPWAGVLGLRALCRGRTSEQSFPFQSSFSLIWAGPMGWSIWPQPQTGQTTSLVSSKEHTVALSGQPSGSVTNQSWSQWCFQLFVAHSCYLEVYCLWT